MPIPQGVTVAPVSGDTEHLAARSIYPTAPLVRRHQIQSRRARHAVSSRLAATARRHVEVLRQPRLAVPRYCVSPHEEESNAIGDQQSTGTLSKTVDTGRSARRLGHPPTPPTPPGAPGSPMRVFADQPRELSARLLKSFLRTGRAAGIRAGFGRAVLASRRVGSKRSAPLTYTSSL